MNRRAFLLIGAMKGGTTSLFHDLIQNPEICIPEKEPSYLTRFDAVHAAAAYRKLFCDARPDQMLGDASTGYSMLPRFPGVAERALTCFGRDIKILYLVRDPIFCTLSHHNHAVNYGMADPDAETALRDDPEIIAQSLVKTIGPAGEISSDDHACIAVTSRPIFQQISVHVPRVSCFRLDRRVHVFRASIASSAYATRQGVSYVELRERARFQLSGRPHSDGSHHHNDVLLSCRHFPLAKAVRPVRAYCNCIKRKT